MHIPYERILSYSDVRGKRGKRASLYSKESVPKEHRITKGALGHFSRSLRKPSALSVRNFIYLLKNKMLLMINQVIGNY